MTYIKLKRSFSFFVMLALFTLTTSTVLAEMVTSHEQPATETTNQNDPSGKSARKQTAAATSTSTLNAKILETFATRFSPECGASRSLIEARIDGTLRRMGLGKSPGYALYSFKLDLQMSEEQIAKLFNDITMPFGFQMSESDRSKLTNSEKFISYVQARATSICQMASAN